MLRSPRSSLSFLVLTSSSLAAVAGCSSTTSVGGVEVCYTADDEAAEREDYEENDVDVEHTGLRVVAAAEAAVAPGGRDCSDLPVHAELVDDNGRHLWVGLSADAGGDQLVPADVFTRLEDARLTIRHSFVFTSSTSVRIDEAGAPVLVLNAGHGINGTEEALVAEGGDTALGTWEQCGSTTEKSLDFAADDDIVSLHNGESGDVVIDGVDYTATNIWTAWYQTNCEDGPSGFETTFALIAD